MTTRSTTKARPTRLPSTRTGWPVAVALVVLSLTPVTAGTLRLLQLAGGPSPLPADDRFPALPVALIVHITGSVCFALLGIGQLIPRFRRRHPTWHRRAGRVLIVAGLAVVASALWLTIGYPTQPSTGPILFAARLLAAAAMGTFVILGWTAIPRRDIPAHQAWMIRAYAIALAAGTQAFTEGIADAILGAGVITGDLAKVAGWLINLAVAEWALRRPTARHRRDLPPLDAQARAGVR